MKRIFSAAFVFLVMFFALSACRSSTQNVGLEGNSSPNSVGVPREQVIHKSMVGNEKTSRYADKPATVEHGVATDPYTGSSDHSNYAAKNESIAPNQVPSEKAQH